MRKPPTRQSPAPAEKFELRRRELAEVTLQTLAELGYARTSLREIAQNSEYSHGVLHYYFKDKLDLISCSVREYKTKCANRYDGIVANARDADALVEGFLAVLAETLRNEAPMHSLWYDLRAQALFEGSFRDDVIEIDRLLQDMVWRLVTRLAAFAGRPPRLSPVAAYALIDGLFQKYLLLHIAGDATAGDSLACQLRLLLPEL